MSIIRAIVLSGGGGKGAYQTGVWKALRQLEIDYDIVTGTSIGALNGAFMVYNDYNTNFKLWNSINYNQVFVSKDKLSIYDKYGKKKVVLQYAKGVLEGGLNTVELKKTIIKNLDIKKFYKSKVNYGLVTVEFPTLKPVCLTKKDIKEENLVDYLLASASAFPALKMTNIDNKKYIDGGYFDNLPINLAIDMGATEIIAVDLKAVGKKKKINNDKKVKMTMISPKIDIGSFLVMEKKNAKKAFKYGYLDTMKIFNKYEGDRYTFKLGSLKRNYDRISNRFFDLYNKYFSDIKKKDNRKIFDETLEKICIAFEIDDTIVYRTSLINEKIKRKYKEIKNYRERNINILKSIGKEEVKKEIICYIYDELHKNNSKKVNHLVTLFPKNFLCAIYLHTINKY